MQAHHAIKPLEFCDLPITDCELAGLRLAIYQGLPISLSRLLAWTREPASPVRLALGVDHYLVPKTCPRFAWRHDGSLRRASGDDALRWPAAALALHALALQIVPDEPLTRASTQRRKLPSERARRRKLLAELV